MRSPCVRSQGAQACPRTAQPSTTPTSALRRRLSTETKSSYKTTELIAYLFAMLGVLLASAMVDASDFGAQEAWFYVSLLTIGYMISRGLAKSGSRDFYNDSRDLYDTSNR